MFSPINLKNRIEIIRDNDSEFINWVTSYIKSEHEKKVNVLSRLDKSEACDYNVFDFDLLDTKNIFHINHIKEICFRYRLRFLDTKHFKGSYPKEAVDKINLLEKEHQIELKGFKIVAPSILFKLKKADDPLLFVPMGNNYYYFIHKWGNDLSPYRRLKFWAIRNVENFAISIFIFSFLLTFATQWFFYSEFNFFYFMIIYLFYLKGVVGFSLYFGIASGKNFSEYAWLSKYDKLS